MSDIIRLLPDSVANQIAAGEVIQRPASVIKELVENSIDAGATNITIVLKDAGKTLIQVIDNGSGMSDTDARLAFERHATSKITNASDLFSLHTMGFRGEALPSIASIAQVDLRTMLKDEPIGTRILISGSKFESQSPEVCVPGTNLMVKNLFFNYPARRKFLKKDSVEMSNIMKEFERLALVNTTVDFTLIHNDITLHSLRRASMKQRIVDLFGKSLDRQIIPIETDTSIVRVSGFIGLPENARRRNPLQYFMVNGRNMRHPYFHKAVLQCYEQLIAPDMQPNYFINLAVDPESIDVNIHPTKNEIKFENEQAIWQILTATIKESLGRFNAVPGIDFDAVDVPDIPVFNPDENASHNIELDPDYNPFAMTDTPVAPSGRIESRLSSGYSGRYRSALNEATQDWEKLYDDFTRKRDSSYSETIGSSINAMNNADRVSLPSAADTSENTLRLNVEAHNAGAMQVKNAYILTPSHDGVMIVDQHRAHVRILYDRYIEMSHLNAFAAQRCMFPEILQLSPAQNAVMTAIIDELTTLGFDLASLGDNSWSINGYPAVLADANVREILLGMVENVTETGEDLDAGLRDRIALSMARGAAIKRGRALTSDEMDMILSDLFKLSSPARTPDGHTVFTIVTIDEIAKMLN